MLSQLDNIIFPDRCEVLEIVPSQRYVYPIFKNGSTSLYKKGYRVLDQKELSQLTEVEIFVRDPVERFFTGLQAFLKYNPDYDPKTTIALVQNHLFLNRHFCPQFHWLVNLQRFAQPKIKISPLEQLKELIPEISNPASVINPGIDLNNHKIQFYCQIDKVLTHDLLGRTVSFSTITKTIQAKYPDIYREVIQRSQDLCSVLD
jgi:hypothetical protein